MRIFWARFANTGFFLLCRLISRRLALLGYGNDWLAQCQGMVMAPGLPVGQHYKVVMNVCCRKSVPNMTLDVART